MLPLMMVLVNIVLGGIASWRLNLEIIVGMLLSMALNNVIMVLFIMGSFVIQDMMGFVNIVMIIASLF